MALLMYRLAIGLGIAGLAVAYQDKLPHVEGRGAGVGGSSQATDLAPITRITGHQGAVTVSPSPTRGGGSCRPAPTRRFACAWRVGTPVRTIELDEGPVTALACRERRAITGHRGGNIVLWDLDKAEKLGTFQHQQAPIAALAFTGDDDHFAVAGQGGSVALFDVRDALDTCNHNRRTGWCTDDRKRARSSLGCLRWPGSQHSPVAVGYGKPHTQLARPGRRTQRARYVARRSDHRQRERERLGAGLVDELVAAATLLQGARGPG